MTTLHNDCSINIKDATTSQLKKSITWWEETLAEHGEDPYYNGLTVRGKAALAFMKAEYSGRVGKKKK